MIGEEESKELLKSIQIDVVGANSNIKVNLIEAEAEPNYTTLDTTATTTSTATNLTNTNSNSNLNLNCSPVHQPFMSSSSNTILKLDEQDLFLGSNKHSKDVPDDSDTGNDDAGDDNEENPTTSQDVLKSFDSETTKRHHSASTNVEQMTFLLSLFDNIVGPKIIHFWQFADTLNSPSKNKKRKSLYKYPLDSQMLKYIAIHTLNGELYQDKLKNQFKYRLYLIKEVECAIFSIFFDAFTITSSASSSCSFAQASLSMENEEFEPQNLAGAASPSTSITDSFLNKNANFLFGGSSTNLNASSGGRERPPLQKVVTSLNCFSIIVPLQCKDLLLNQYGDTTSFLINSFENYLVEFKVYAHIKPKRFHVTTAIENLTKSIKKFCSNIYTLKTRGLILNRLSPYIEQAIPTKILIRDTFLNECNFTTASTSYNTSINNDLLVNAITSHLITNFNTIVIGKTSASINRMISTLALFMPKEKLTISCFALDDTSKLSPFYCLQGIVTDNPENLESIVDYNFLFQRESPTTIVDLSYKMVHRTAILNDFEMARENFLKQKIRFLYNSVSLDTLNSMCPVVEYIKWVSSESYSQKSTLITTMLKQLDLLESEFGVKDSYFDLVQKDLYLMALNLIEFINNEYTAYLVNKKEKQVMRISEKKIMKELDIKTLEDLHVLIAFANYLKPGFSSNLSLTH